VEAKDSKGDHIHQTLMAKKMQRLDESPDFRPFKFRIQAFTTAFLEEVSTFTISRQFCRPLTTLNSVGAPGLYGRQDSDEKGQFCSSFISTSFSRYDALHSDPQLPMAPTPHPTLQRGWKEGQVERKPHLER
jgi:hypothetical protein